MRALALVAAWLLSSPTPAPEPREEAADADGAVGSESRALASDEPDPAGPEAAEAEADTLEVSADPEAGDADEGGFEASADPEAGDAEADTEASADLEAGDADEGGSASATEAVAALEVDADGASEPAASDSVSDVASEGSEPDADGVRESEDEPEAAVDEADDDALDPELSALKKSLACNIDQPEWREFRVALEYAVANADDSDPRIDDALQRHLSARTREVGDVLECNVGIVAGYYHLAQRVLHFRPYDLERAYSLLQLAMIFIFTLRNAVRIPTGPANEWQVTERDVILQIRGLKATVDKQRAAARAAQRPVSIAPTFRDPNMRIAVVGICAYPEDHPIALKTLTPKNREVYARRHGYDLRMHFEHPIIGGDVHIQHSKLALVGSYVLSGQYDWIAWFDCDSIIMNMDKTLDSIIYQYAHVPSFEPREDEDVERPVGLSGLWRDWFAGAGDDGATPHVFVEDDEGSLKATAPQLGSGPVVGERLQGRNVTLDFPDGRLYAELSEDQQTLYWSNGAIWTLEVSMRGRKEPGEPVKCSNELGCALELDESAKVLITEEGWGLSSANWIVRGSVKRGDEVVPDLWTAKFLNDAFQTAHVKLPLFGDQDAMILLLLNPFALAEEGEAVDPYTRIVPQDSINAYDALNAYTMHCHAYEEGDLLVTFPSCKDPGACNPLFEVAAEYALNPREFSYTTSNWAHIRLFGPRDLIAHVYRDMLEGKRAAQEEEDDDE